MRYEIFGEASIKRPQTSYSLFDSAFFGDRLCNITGIPKNSGAAFIFKGRAFGVFVRYKKSPNGWSSIREIILPGL